MPLNWWIIGSACVALLANLLLTVAFMVLVNATFTLVNIAIAVTEGIGKQLDPEVDLIDDEPPAHAGDGRRDRAQFIGRDLGAGRV